MKKRILANTGLLALVSLLANDVASAVNTPSGLSANAADKTNMPALLSEEYVSEVISNTKASICSEGAGCLQHQYLLDTIRSNKMLIEALQQQSAQARSLPVILTNAELIVRLTRSNEDLEAEYRRLHPPPGALEWASNVLRGMKWTPPWPDPDKKQQMQKQWATLVRSAIDTNQVEVACARMTNTPTEVSALRMVTKAATSRLEEFASVLTNAHLNTYMGVGGPRTYRAKLETPTDYYSILFRTEDGPIQHFEKRTPDGRVVLVRVDFYEDGRLRALEESSLDSNGLPKTEMQLFFKDDGTLRSHWIRPSQTKP